MPVSVTMPRLGESVTEGTVTRWLKHEGERVEADEPLLEVSTDKVDTEIPSPAAGVLHRIVVQEDETAEVGSELAVISGDEEAQGATVEERRPAPDVDEPSTEKPVNAEAPAPQSGTAAPTGAGAPPNGGAAGPNGAGQASVVTMPALGESVTEGTVTRWLKQVGDQVTADEPLLEVSTDKVDTEIPAPATGTLLEIVAREDETVAVGARLAVIGSSGASTETRPAPAQPGPDAQTGTPAQAEAPAPSAPAAQPSAPAAQPPAHAAPEPAAAPQAAAPPAPAPQVPAQQAPAQQAPTSASTPAPAPAPAGINGEDTGGYVTPLVRKLAAESGIDLSSVRGTGVGGRIRKQDVLEAAEQQRAAAAAAAAAAPTAPAAVAGTPAAAPSRPQPSPLRGRTEKLPRMRALIARRMVESLQISAQLTTVVEVDVTTIARLRDAAKAEFQRREGVKLSFLPFFALAAVEALRVHPNVNASIDLEAGTVTYHDAEHLGMAVDTERGLMVPVIRNAGDLNLAGLARRIADLAERTRTNRVTPDELSGGTFTLTNTGSRGALFDTPIINQPQVAILGTGAVVKRAVVINDPALGEVIVPRSMVYLAMSYDHRLVDGADAARFLATVKERLEGGAFEAELGL